MRVKSRYSSPSRGLNGNHDSARSISRRIKEPNTISEQNTRPTNGVNVSKALVDATCSIYATSLSMSSPYSSSFTCIFFLCTHAQSVMSAERMPLRPLRCWKLSYRFPALLHTVLDYIFAPTRQSTWDDQRLSFHCLSLLIALYLFYATALPTSCDFNKDSLLWWWLLLGLVVVCAFYMSLSVSDRWAVALLFWFY